MIVLAGVHFMAGTAKLLNPEKTVLTPDLEARCSLAKSITAQDVRLMRFPGGADRHYTQYLGCREGRSDICCTSGIATAFVEPFGVPRVIKLPDEYLAKNVTAETNIEIIAWKGHGEVHERFSGADIRELLTHIPASPSLPIPKARQSVAEADSAARPQPCHRSGSPHPHLPTQASNPR
ncbi:quinolinate synthase NadA [Mesorhizobium sp. M0923]